MSCVVDEPTEELFHDWIKALCESGWKDDDSELGTTAALLTLTETLSNASIDVIHKLHILETLIKPKEPPYS